MEDGADVFDAGQMGMGCLEQPPETRSLGSYTGQRIDRSQWTTVNTLKRFVPVGKCQFDLPGCCSWTTGKAVQTKYAYMVGGGYPQLSYAALHQLVTGGRMNRGARPIDSIEGVAKSGIPIVTPQLPEFFKSVRQLPKDAVEAGRAYLAHEWEECQSPEDVVSALLNNDPVNIGIWWYDSDANPGPSGHLPVRGSGGKGGHSVEAYGVLMGYPKSPSGVGIVFSNHHGDKAVPAFKDERGRTLRSGVWGDDGCGVVPIERLIDGIPAFGCYALRTVTIRNEDLNIPDPNFL